MRTIVFPLLAMILVPAANATPDVPPPDLDVTFIANDGFLIQAAHKKVLIDALFTLPSGIPPPELVDELSSARGPFADVDLILITHSHGDHVNAAMVNAHLRNNPRCRLVAHAETVGELRKDEGFGQVRDRIHEVTTELGSHERVTANGVTVDVLPVAHSPHPQEDGSMVPNTGKHLAFVVNLAGARFLHVGDTWIGDSDTTAHINAYTFEEAPIRILFMNFFCRTPADQDVIARRIKPEHIVAMHIAPEELERESENVRAVYPDAVVFAGSMERRVFK